MVRFVTLPYLWGKLAMHAQQGGKGVTGQGAERGKLPGTLKDKRGAENEPAIPRRFVRHR